MNWLLPDTMSICRQPTTLVLTPPLSPLVVQGQTDGETSAPGLGAGMTAVGPPDGAGGLAGGGLLGAGLALSRVARKGFELLPPLCCLSSRPSAQRASSPARTAESSRGPILGAGRGVRGHVQIEAE